MSAGFPFEGDEDFYASIGKLTISWAYVEFGLDWLIREIHEPLDGQTIVESEIPISLQRKVKYLRRAFNKLPQLAQFRGRFEKIADETIAASTERHDLIHGFIISQQGDKAIMVRMLPGVKKPKLFPVTTVSILKAAVRADAIQAQSLASDVASFLDKK